MLLLRWMLSLWVLRADQMVLVSKDGLAHVLVDLLLVVLLTLPADGRLLGVVPKRLFVDHLLGVGITLLHDGNLLVSLLSCPLLNLPRVVEFARLLAGTGGSSRHGCDHCDCSSAAGVRNWSLPGACSWAGD